MDKAASRIRLHVIRACHHIFKQKSLRCIANVVLLEANGTTIAMQRRLK